MKNSGFVGKDSIFRGKIKMMTQTVRIFEVVSWTMMIIKFNMGGVGGAKVLL